MTKPTSTDKPDYPAPGSEIPGQPGYVVAECLHRIAGSEWAAGFRVCEHCPPSETESQPEPELEKMYVFTFGTRHRDPHNPDIYLDGRYVRIWGTYERTRQVMLDHFGNNWAFQYGSEDSAGVDRFNLIRYIPEWRTTS